MRKKFYYDYVKELKDDDNYIPYLDDFQMKYWNDVADFIEIITSDFIQKEYDTLLEDGFTRHTLIITFSGYKKFAE